MRRAIAGFAACLGLAAGPLHAQDQPFEAQVEQIAGSDIYLGAGTDVGVVTGSILLVLGADGQDELGRLRVIEATTKRSIATFVGTPFAVTRGSTLRLRIEASADGRPPPAPAAVGAAAAAADTPATRTTASSSRASTGPG